MNKKELEDFLNYHNHLYYDLDSPEIDDDEYNEYKDKYVEQYGEYNYVPGNVSDSFEKYEHSTYVSSLDKVKINEEEKLRENIKRLWPIVIQPKMDGLTIVTYPDGTQVTRGTGHIGEIVTNNVNKADGIGTPFSAFPVRSELVMLHSEFNRVNEERIANGLETFKNCRNAAAGMIRNLDNSKIQGLKIFAYNLLFNDEGEDYEDYDDDDEEESEECENASAQTQIDYLKLNNWNTVDSYEPKDIEDAMNYIMNFDRESLDYDIDGLVIKHNGSKKFGQTEHHPLNAIAVKFVPAGAWTKIKDIKWTIGRTGKLTPIAILEPVEINGSTIKKATLHNINIINMLNLNTINFKGKFGQPLTEVYVIKSNDVIPAITDVRNDITDLHNVYCKSIFEPKQCPICGSELRKENNLSYCDNKTCESKILNRLIHLAQRDAFNIRDLGEETCEKLINKYKEIMEKTLTQIMNSQEVAGPEDDYIDEEELVTDKLKKLHPSLIYELSKKNILSLEGFAEKSAQTLYDNIQKSKNITFEKFLYGCGIPLVGRRAARDIAEAYYPNELSNFVDDYYNNFKKLQKVKGIGTATINSIINYYDDYIVPFGEFMNITDYIPKKKSSNQLTFVITGEFDISREEIKKEIEDAGHKVTGSVSKKTDYILIGEKAGKTKLEKAEEFNIKILNSLDELRQLL